MRKKY